MTLTYTWTIDYDEISLNEFSKIIKDAELKGYTVEYGTDCVTVTNTKSFTNVDAKYYDYLGDRVF